MIVLGGVAVQLAGYLLFNIVFLSFWYRVQKDQPPLLQKLRPFMWGILFSSFFIILRSIYRVIEMAFGWDGIINTTEWAVYSFDAAFVVIAVYILNAYHPGKYLPNKFSWKYKPERDGPTDLECAVPPSENKDLSEENEHNEKEPDGSNGNDKDMNTHPEISADGEGGFATPYSSFPEALEDPNIPNASNYGTTGAPNLTNTTGAAADGTTAAPMTAGVSNMTGAPDATAPSATGTTSVTGVPDIASGSGLTGSNVGAAHTSDPAGVASSSRVPGPPPAVGAPITQRAPVVVGAPVASDAPGIANAQGASGIQ